MLIRRLIQGFKEGMFNVFPRFLWSQDGTDIFLGYYFRGKTGRYVDVGAYHPFRFSNTAMLYYSGWSGWNVDPSAKAERLFGIWRKRDMFIRAMIGDGSNVHYELRKDGACNGAGATGEMFKTIELSSLLMHAFSSFKVDLLSIDAEGMDLNILKSNDWEKYRPTLIVVEVNHGGDFDAFMQSVGYRLIGKTILNNIYEDERQKETRTVH